jgi:cell division protein FtsL
MTTKDIKRKIMYILGGTVLTEDFFWKNARFIITVFVIIVLYISNRYSCIEKVSTIEKLQRELKDAKYESLTISAELMGVSRESKVVDLVQKNGVDLKQTNEPIYKIKKEK